MNPTSVQLFCELNSKTFQRSALPSYTFLSVINPVAPPNRSVITLAASVMQHSSHWSSHSHLDSQEVPYHLQRHLSQREDQHIVRSSTRTLQSRRSFTKTRLDAQLVSMRSVPSVRTTACVFQPTAAVLLARRTNVIGRH